MASVAFHEKFIQKHVGTSMECPTVYHDHCGAPWKIHMETCGNFHGIPWFPYEFSMEYYDSPYKLRRFSMEKPWQISVRE